MGEVEGFAAERPWLLVFEIIARQAEDQQGAPLQQVDERTPGRKLRQPRSACSRGSSEATTLAAPASRSSLPLRSLRA